MTAEIIQQVVFIDARVPDIQDLLAGLQPGEQAFVIDSSSDGIQQVADILAANNFTDLTSISIVSHGETGELELGSSFVSDGNLASHASALAEIGSSLAPSGTIQLYGCDVAQGAAGQQFINDFSTYAGGVTVEAATHLVGSSGGWTLDAASAGGAPLPGGVPAVNAPFTPAALGNFHGTLLASDPQLWIAGGSSPDQIIHVDDLGGVATNATTLYAGNTHLHNIEGVALDPTNQTYFVLHQNPDGTESILKGSLVQAVGSPSASPTFTTVYTDATFGNITQIAVDSVSHQIYFTDNVFTTGSSLDATFRRINYDGTGLTTLATVATGQSAGAVGFALDLNLHEAIFGVNVGGFISFTTTVAPSSFLYEASGLSSAASSVTITQLPLAGAGTFTLDPSLGFFTQNGGLAIDPNSHKLYFTLENGPTDGGLFEYDLTGNANGNINTVWQQTTAGPTGAPVELAIDPTTGEYFIGFNGGSSSTGDQFNGLWRGQLNSTAAPTSFLDFPDDGSVQPFEFALDQQPTLSITATNPTFTESTLNPAATHNTPVAVVSAATPTDPDNSALVSATVSISNLFAGDAIGFSTAGTSITASYNSSTGVLTLSGIDSFAHYQSVLESITFTSTSDNPTDYGSDPTRILTWTVNDGLLASAPQTETLTVVGVNDAPTLTGTANASFTEGGAAVTLSPSVTVSDPDNLTLTSATVAITGGTFAGDGDVLATNVAGTAITASYNAATETLTLTGSDTFAHYQQVLDRVTFVTASDNPDNFGAAPTRTVTWTLNDGSASNATGSATSAISITAVNDPPTLAGTANASYTENAAPVTLSPAALVTDPDSLNLVGATVAIIGGTFAGDGDILSANTTGTAITASYNAATELLVLSGSDTLAHYQQVLDSVAFASSSDNPDDYGSAPIRGVTWQLNDGSGSNNLSTVVTTTIGITAVNDAPTLAGTTNASFTEGGAAVSLSPTASVSDPDSLTLVGATVAITGGTFVGDGDLLSANVAGTAITASYNAATETLVLSGSDSLAHYQQVLDSVTFVTASDNPDDFGSAPARTVTWSLDDGSGSNNLSAVTTTTVTITAVNDAPALGGTTNASFTEGGAAVSLSPTASVSDPDSLTLVGATVALTGGTFAGDGDVLSANVAGTAITASYDSTTETLTLSGIDSLAHYQQVLDSVTFVTASDNPDDFGSAPTRTVTWTLDDGSGSNATGSATSAVSITAVNDAPTLAGTANASFTENGSPVTLSPAAAVTDPDSLNLAGATVGITGGTFAGDGDVLSANVAGTAITASYNAATETLVLSGSDTLAHYQQVLDSVAFSTSSDNPDNFGAAPTRTVTWSLDDGSGSNNLSAVSTTTIGITAVNDPPTLSNVAATAGYTEQAAATTLSGSLVVSDPDSLTLANATVKIVGGAFAGDGDVLAANVSGTGITASYNSSTETLVLSGLDTLAHYQSVLDSVTFFDAIDNPTNYGSNTTRTITWTVTDGSASNNTSTAQTTTLNVTAVNDAPTLAGVPSTASFKRGHTLTIAPSASVSDPDNLTLANATVAITGGTFAGDNDVLGANVSGTNITASYNAATETLTLTGSDTLAHYQQVLDSVTFNTTGNSTNSGANPTRTVTWTVNDGSGSNNTAVATTTISISGGVKNDFDGDGTSDIAFQRTSGATAEWLINNNSVTATATQSVPNASWRLIGSGDFNGDGDADLLFQKQNGTPMIRTMDGLTVTSSTTFSNPGANWHAVGTGDFNGDSDADILFQNVDGTPQIWTMNGTSVVSTATLADPGITWKAVDTGDFNGDGKSDIVFQNIDGTPMIWTMNGTSVTSTATLANPGITWKLVGTGDFNGDGNSDLLFQNALGTPQIWTMNGTSVTSTATLANPGVAWKAVGTGDYNGDGKSDILFQNVDGTPQIWSMNGTTVTATTTLANPGVQWHANSG